MKIAVPRETAPGEKRVALVPESVKRLAAKGHAVIVQGGAGEGSEVPDAEYQAAGATIEASAEAVFGTADVVVKVQPPRAEELLQVRAETGVASLLFPLTNRALVESAKERRISALALELVPRTTAAQMMDVLSSQATLAGYRAVLLAAEKLPKLFPLLMTAAGTISPSRVLVLGAGVAGLQAVATARRLGAVVEAFDVRRAAKEQVESLGAKFVEVAGEDAQTAGGYAREVSEDYKRRQAALLEQHLSKADVCITTALIPGKRAPVLVSAAMVEKMRPGSVIVDLAAEQGGNCELTRAGETARIDGVTIVGELNVASQMAVHASQMFSRNVEKLLLHLSKDGAFHLDPKDEITRGMLVTHRGELVHPELSKQF